MDRRKIFFRHRASSKRLQNPLHHHIAKSPHPYNTEHQESNQSNIASLDSSDDVQCFQIDMIYIQLFNLHKSKVIGMLVKFFQKTVTINSRDSFSNWTV